MYPKHKDQVYKYPKHKQVPKIQTVTQVTKTKTMYTYLQVSSPVGENRGIEGSPVPRTPLLRIGDNKRESLKGCGLDVAYLMWACDGRGAKLECAGLLWLFNGLGEGLGGYCLYITIILYIETM